MPQGGFAFDRLIAPISRSTFLRDHYEQAPLILHRNDPDYFAELLDLPAVWHHIETMCPGPDDLRLVKYGCPQQPDDYMGPNRRCNPARVAAMFTDGWTVALNRMHERMPALAGLTAAAEVAFSAPFQANLYLTPPGAQGFMAHWDTHDVFVLQIHGSKDWTLYDTQIELPMIGQSFDDHKPPPGPVSAEFTLQAGDLLYCPRGLMHAAHSGLETSLHITFGLMAKTWTELLVEAVAQAALASPALRQNLPAGFAQAGFSREIARTQFSNVMKSLTEAINFEAVFDQMRETFSQSRIPRRPGLAGEVARLSALAPGTRIAARPDLVWHLDTGENSIAIVCAGHAVTFPDFTRTAVEHAMNGAATEIAALPGPLDEPGKLTLIRRLICEGLVVTLV